MEIPNQNLSVLVVGNENAGKSTVTNLIIGDKLSETAIGPVTTCPIVFIENKTDTDLNVDKKLIFNKIKETNEKKNINELMFNINKFDINITENSSINLFDVPGLNHLSEKNDYEYIVNNFSKMNIVIYVIDIHTTFNSIDDINLLNLVGEQIKINRDTHNKDTYILFIFNKADDMQLTKNEKTNKDELHLEESLQYVFNKTYSIINNELIKYGILDNIIGFLPLCALDAFLYRIMLKYGNNYEFEDADLLRIGNNQMGKKFSRLNKSEQKEEIKKIIKDKKSINDMIKLSGFNNFQELLHNFLLQNEQKLISGNLCSDIKTIPDFKLIFSENNNIEQLKTSVDKYISILNKIKSFNLNMYNEYLSQYYNQMMEGIEINIKIVKSISNIKNYYDDVYDKIILVYFNEVKNSEKYPSFLKSKILTIVKKYVSNEKLKISTFYDYIDICININILNNEYLINDFLMDILSNYEKNKEKTFIFQDNQYGKEMHLLEVIIPFLLKDYTFNISLLEQILRVMLICSLSTKVDKPHDLIRKKMIYDKHGEIVMSNYINFFIMNFDILTGNLIKSKLYIEGLPHNGNSIDYQNDRLEKIYIDFLKKHRDVNIY